MSRCLVLLSSVVPTAIAGHLSLYYNTLFIGFSPYCGPLLGSRIGSVSPADWKCVFYVFTCSETRFPGF